MADCDEMGKHPVPVCECQERQSSKNPNRMLIISAVVQWMLMLTCIVYLLTQHHTEKTEVMKTSGTNYVFTILPNEINGPPSKRLVVNHYSGNMEVKNGSVLIPVEGRYLVYFEGLVDDNQSNNIVTVFVRQPHENTNRTLFAERIRNGEIRAMALKDLKSNSEIYVEKDSSYPKFESFQLAIYLL